MPSAPPQAPPMTPEVRLGGQAQQEALRETLARMEAKFANPEVLAKLNPVGLYMVALCLRAARKEAE